MPKADNKSSVGLEVERGRKRQVRWSCQQREERENFHRKKEKKAVEERESTCIKKN